MSIRALLVIAAAVAVVVLAAGGFTRDRPVPPPEGYYDVKNNPLGLIRPDCGPKYC